MKMLLMTALAFASLTLTACGSKSCKDFCNHPCGGASVADCQAGCVKSDALASSSGCQSKYNTMLSCFGGLSDSDRCSTTNTLCQSEATAFFGCAADYCTAHTSDANCH